jgi:pimeloyl-ACP methyl ester carboxylesterase
VEEAPGVDELHVTSKGTGDLPVVLVHGFGGSSHSWRFWIPTLAARHRVHLVDLAGAGRAPAPPRADYSARAQAQRLAAFITRLESPPPVVIGHSLGAGIAVLATLLLRDDPDAPDVGALVLVSGAVYPQPLPRYLTLARMARIGEALMACTPPRIAMRIGIRGIVSRRECIDAELIEGYRHPLQDPARRQALLKGARSLDLEEAGRISARLPEIDVPVLLVWGAEDRIVRADLGHRLAKDFPDASLVVLPGVGHLPPEEDPEASLGPVLGFLSGLCARPSDAP